MLYVVTYMCTIVGVYSCAERFGALFVAGFV